MKGNDEQSRKKKQAEYPELWGRARGVPRNERGCMKGEHRKPKHEGNMDEQTGNSEALVKTYV